MNKLILGGVLAAAMLAGGTDAGAYEPLEHEVFARIEEERLAATDADLGEAVAKAKKEAQEARKEERKIIDSATFSDVLKICDVMEDEECDEFLLALLSDRGRRLTAEEIGRVLERLGPGCDTALQCRMKMASQHKFLETVDLPWAEITGAELHEHILPPLRSDLRPLAVQKWREAVLAKEKMEAGAEDRKILKGETGKRPQDRDCLGGK